MLNSSRRIAPLWLWGVLVALVLIVISMRSRATLVNQALQQQFVMQPTPAGIPLTLPGLGLDQLPLEAQQAARDMQRRLGLGESVPGLTPVAQSPRLRVEIREVKRVNGGVQVLGQVTNISPAEVQVPVSAFELRDSTGATYIADGGGNARLSPGASTPLDLTIPLPTGRGLLLTLRFPPDPPVEQVLLVGG